MKNRVISRVGIAVVLLLLVGLVGCVMPDQPSSQPPENTYSTGDLLANLDALQGPSARSLSVVGKSVFTLPGGGQLSTQDLASYLSAIKTNFANYASSLTRGSPYLVTAVKLSWGGSNSGLMWVPFTWFHSASFPVISYQHGTQVYRPIAPSRFDVNPLDVFSSPDQMGALQNYVECVVGALMASAGSIVVMPDYQGFGDSGVTHPYVTATLGDSVTGAVAAAQAALARSVVKPKARLFLTGYSEGGYATMAAARAFGGAVTATVACDGPYDLSGTMVQQMLSTTQAPKVPWYLLYTASGFNAAYGIDLPSLINATWFPKLSLFDGTHTNPQIDTAVPAGTFPSDMLTPGALSDLSAGTGIVFGTLEANDGWVGWTPRSPVVLVHCPQDDVVPVANRDVAVAQFQEEGVGVAALVKTIDVQPVTFIESLLGSTHVAAYPTAMLAAFTAIHTIDLSTP